MSSTSSIKLTDRFLIERHTENGTQTMTIDGHDLKEFTLELQSAFTEEIEQKVLTLEAQGLALETDLYEFINVTEPGHHQEIIDDLDELDRKVGINETQIEVTRKLAESIKQSTRIVGKYFLRSDVVESTDLRDGDMKLAPKGLTTFEEVTTIWLRDIDLLKIDAGQTASKYRTDYENILPGDIMEISGSNTIGVTFRAIYIVNNVQWDGQARRTKFTVEFVEAAGDTEGMPWQDDEDKNDSNRKDTRVEIFPSVPTESFALKIDYEALAKAAYPIGIVVAWFTNDIPDGWLICDGSTIDSATDSRLTELSNMFNGKLPDCRGRALIQTGGFGLSTVNTFVEQTTAKPLNTPRSTTAGAHTHTTSMTSNGSHYHYYGDKTRSGGGTTKTAYGAQTGGGYRTSESGSHTHTLTIDQAGEHHHEITGWDTYNRMYSRTCHFIIKAYHASES